MNKTELTRKHKEIIDFYNGDEFVANIWETKYGRVNDHILVSPKEAWEIMAKELETQFVSKEELLEAFTGFKLVPAGRIMHGLLRYHFSDDRNQLNLNLSNCAFIGGPDDSLESIMDYAQKHATLLKYGYGNGLNLDNIRPEGCPVNNAAKTTAGIVPFMHLYSQVTQTIGHAGRRGASILTLPIYHPDILNFIKSKTYDQNDITGANISVRITNDFMKAVENDDDWTLYFENNKATTSKTIKARKLFDTICEAAYDWGEPGIIFEDTMRENNPGIINKESTPVGVNPCGEITMAPYEQCVLGSVMLDKFIEYDEENQCFHMNELSYVSTIETGIKMLNSVLNYEIKYDLFPLEKMKEQAVKYGRIGLGVSGVADALGFLNQGYNTNESTMKTLDFIFKTLHIVSYETSHKLFEEHQIFAEGTDDPYFYDTAMFKSMSNYTIDYKLGLANISCNTIAPNGSISIVAGGMYDSDNEKMIYTQCSSGIEPVMYRQYNRKTIIDGKETINKIEHGAIKYIKSLFPNLTDKELKQRFPTIDEVNWKDKVEIQGYVQKYIDNSISSTVNLPEHATLDDVKNLYLLAWKKGCKGITVFRNNCKRMGIINKIENKQDNNYNKLEHISRPSHLSGYTEKIKFPNYDVFITVNHLEDGTPLEIFLNVGKSGSEVGSFSEAIGRLVSLAMSYKIPIKEIAKQLEHIVGGEVTWHNYGNENKSKMTVSIMDAIAKTLKCYYDTNNTYIKQIENDQNNETKPLLNEELKDNNYEICPKCKEKSLVRSNGCISCIECGYSKCN